jgi:hypothetical protein
MGAVGLWLSVALFSVSAALASGTESLATNAVTAILFEEDAEEFTSYRVSERGHVDVTFARNTPDAIYSRILNKLKHHQDISGVLAGKSGPVCRRF